MKALEINLEDPKAARAALQGVFTEMQTSYGELIKLAPESLQAQLKGIKTRVDEFLSGLASRPTDQVPAANEASWALKSLAVACAQMKELYDGAQAMITALNSRYTPMATELQSFQGRVEKGELLTAEQVEKKVTEAVEKAVSAEKARAAMLAARRTELQSANLPVPADNVIALEKEEDFVNLKKEGTSRLKQLTDAGLAKNLNATELQSLCYGTKDNFEMTLKLAKGMAGAGGGAGDGKTTMEPLLDGGNSGGAGGDQKKRRLGF